MAKLAELFQSLGSSVNTMTGDLRSAELENKMEEDKLGVSGTDVRQIPMGVLNALDAMSGNRGQLALDYANQAIPMPEEANKYEAALRFFLEMGKQASQPGSTVLGSAFGAGQAPLDYLTAKNAEIRKAKQARAALGLQIAPSLKPKAKTGAGTAVKVVDEKGNVKFMSTAQAIKTGATPYIAPPAGSKQSLATKNYTVTADGGITIGTNLIPQGDVVQLTDAQRSIFGPTDLGPYEKAGSGDKGQTFTFTSPEAAEAWQLAHPDYTVTEDQKEGRTSILLPQSMGLIPANSGLIIESTKPSDPESVFKNFRTFYTKDPDVINYQELKGHMDNVATAYEQAYIIEQPQVADLSMIFAYMKMLDPTSVVRESEQDQARRTGGAADWLVNYVESLKGGGSLRGSQRRSFRDGAYAFYKNKTQGLSALNERFTAEATNRGLLERFNNYKIEPKEYDLKYFGEYPGDSAIEAKVGTEGLDELSIIAQYENITEPQIAKIRQQIAAIRRQLGLPPSNN